MEKISDFLLTYMIRGDILIMYKNKGQYGIIIYSIEYGLKIIFGYSYNIDKKVS